jgi:hypothetical protein
MLYIYSIVAFIWRNFELSIILRSRVTAPTEWRSDGRTDGRQSQTFELVFLEKRANKREQRRQNSIKIYGFHFQKLQREKRMKNNVIFSTAEWNGNRVQPNRVWDCCGVNKRWNFGQNNSLNSHEFPCRKMSDVCFVSASHRREKMLWRFFLSLSSSRREKKSHCFSCSREHVKIIITNAIVSDVTTRKVNAWDKLKCKKVLSLSLSLVAFMINVWQIMAFPSLEYDIMQTSAYLFRDFTQRKIHD